MATRRKSDEQWRRMAALLHRQLPGQPITLALAHELFEAAPDIPLDPVQVQSIVAHVLYQRAASRAASCFSGSEDLVFSAETWAVSGGDLVEPPRLIGTDRPTSMLEGMTRIESTSVDTRWLTLRRSRPLYELTGNPTEAVVLDVALDLRRWHEPHDWAICEGTLHLDACLEGGTLDASQFSSEIAAWCDGIGQESQDVAQFGWN